MKRAFGTDLTNLQAPPAPSKATPILSYLADKMVACRPRLNAGIS
jgi:hypothetical protein